MNILALTFQDAAGGGAGFLGGFGGILIPIALMIGVFYFLVIMPQRKQQQQLKDMVAALKIGDRIVTNGGVIGIIASVSERSFVIRSADKTLIEIARSAVVGIEAESKSST
jgi:preprotein translocase subunit YajC